MHADQIRRDLRVDITELAVPRESGIVHQQVRFGGGDNAFQVADVARIGQVCGAGLHAHSMLSSEPPGQGA